MKRILLLLAILALPAGSHAARQGGDPVALVTAETQNQLIAVELPSGRILRRLTMPVDPQNVEANDRVAVVVSTRGAAVTIVDLARLRIRKVIRGFGSPHIAALSPGGRYAYVTDDARGELIVINLARSKVDRRLFVGLGAHHMAVRPDGQQLWIALGERARRIVICDTSNAARPRVIGDLTPDGAAPRPRLCAGRRARVGHPRRRQHGDPLRRANAESRRYARGGTSSAARGVQPVCVEEGLGPPAPCVRDQRVRRHAPGLLGGEPSAHPDGSIALRVVQCVE
jgi:hypothetical protein